MARIVVSVLIGSPSGPRALLYTGQRPTGGRAIAVVHPRSRGAPPSGRRRVRRQEREPGRAARGEDPGTAGVRAERGRLSGASSRRPASPARSRRLWRAHASDDVDALTAASKAIDEAMRFAPLSDAVRVRARRALRGAAQATGKIDARGRALERARGGQRGDSYAGQQESFLWVRGVEHVCDAVRDCWASLFTPQAISYRLALGSPSTRRRWA